MSPGETMGGPGPERASTISALEALEGLPIAGARGLAATRLTPAVAATLRAAVDLLLGDEPPRRPLAAAGDGGALEVIVPHARAEGLAALGSLLETVEGNASPVAGGGLRVCVPAASARPFYLMIEQGTLGLAIPWHTVIRIRLVRPEHVEELARREGCAVLSPWVRVPHQAEERPAILVGLGMRRALLLADRLVWRMPADPEAGPGPAPDSDLGHAVRTTEGEVFWVADPARLLRGVEPTSVPSASLRPPTKSRPAPPAPKGTPGAPAPQRPPAPRLIELRREDVEPLAPSPAKPVGATDRPAEPASTAPARRALVAEDSIVGRIFLQRLLHALGFDVETVTSAMAFHHALGRGPWDVMFVDVELPDSSRAAHLKWLTTGRFAGAGSPVALVRDRDDEEAAALAGVRVTLRKPFERSDLLRVLVALGLVEKAS